MNRPTPCNTAKQLQSEHLNMNRLILIAFLVVTACNKKTADQTSAAVALAGSCQLQSVQPAPQYGNGVSIKTYLCNQFRPSCIVAVLSSPALDQVPAIVSNTCPQMPPLNQVPPRLQ